MDRIDLIGQTISHYEVQEKLGEGGMGVVYRALDNLLGRTVAIKFLTREKVFDPDRKKRFIQEAKAASALNHPNIITIYEIGDAGGLDYIVMEYVQGQALYSCIPKKGLRLAEALKYAIQITDALAAAHAAGIVHRDLKPANIMVTDKGLIKLLDFGLAKLVEAVEPESSDLAATMDQMPRTVQGVIVGTVAYMSPEQAEGKKVDGRSDIFTFGSLLYEMCTGRRPFEGQTTLSTLSAILSKDPRPVSEVTEALPRDLERIIQRCLRKEPERRIQHMDDLKLALEELKEESQAAYQAIVRSSQDSKGGWSEDVADRKALVAGIALGFLLAGLVGALLWWIYRAPTTTRGPVLTRLTSDYGLSAYPALSADGKLLAYASDRSGEGNLDIFVQQIGGGDPIRITRHEADDYDPSFSPDGTRIAFRSERDGGGIYVVPALGGEPRLVVKNGRRPRFSPDGSLLAYWAGAMGQAFLPGSAKIYVVSSSGGEPRQVRPEFAAARHPIWDWEGKRLLFLGRLDPKGPREQAVDWWLAPLDGGQAVRTGVLAMLRGQNLSPPRGEYEISPEMWAPEGDAVLFSATSGDSTNVWQMPLSRKGRAAGEAQQRTFGAALEVQASVARGVAVAFSSLTLNVDVWSLAAEPNRAEVTGVFQPITQDLSFDGYPSISLDGKKLAFLSSRSGGWDVWMRDLATGKERALTANRLPKLRPKISPDGARVLYEERDNQRTTVYLVSSANSVPEKLCDGCGIPTQFSPDGRKALLEPIGPTEVIRLLDLASRNRTELIQFKDHPNYMPYAASFSPDQRWIAFHAAMENPVGRKIFIVPFRHGQRVAESEWIAVTDGSALEREPAWSPDGNLLYFLSDRDGFRCIFAQRLEPGTKRPAGSAFPVYHLHQARRSLTGVGGGSAAIGLSVARDKIVFAAAELTGNIWMARSTTGRH